MTDTNMDESIVDQHEMNVDDAEMQQAQVEAKQQKLLQQYEDMMNDINLTKKKRLQAEKEYEQLMKDINFEGAFSDKKKKQAEK